MLYMSCSWKGVVTWGSVFSSVDIYKDCDVPTHVLPSGASCSPGDGHWHRTSPFSTSQPYWQLAMPQVRASDGHNGNTTHINTCWCHKGEKRSVGAGEFVKLTLSLSFLLALYPYPPTGVWEPDHCLPLLILAELTLRCRQQNSTHSAIIRFLCCAVALRLHLCPRNPPSPTFILYYT